MCIKFADSEFYNWVERGTVRVKCFVQEHNVMSPARGWARTARSGDELLLNHEATASVTWINFEEYIKHLLMIYTKELIGVVFTWLLKANTYVNTVKPKQTMTYSHRFSWTSRWFRVFGWSFNSFKGVSGTLLLDRVISLVLVLRHSMARMHLTSRQPYCCSKTMQRQRC